MAMKVGRPNKPWSNTGWREF